MKVEQKLKAQVWYRAAMYVTIFLTHALVRRLIPKWPINENVRSTTKKCHTI